MKRLFNEYAEVLIAIIATLISISIVCGIFYGINFIEFIKEGVYGL